MLTFIGSEALDIYNTFSFEDDDYEVDDKGVRTAILKFDRIIGKFDVYCNPRSNITFERYKFRSTIQDKYESMDKFITDLKNKVSTLVR